MEKLGVVCCDGWIWGWSGDDWGEPEEREPSDDEEWIDINCYS
jgi:hypothetical protein